MKPQTFYRRVNKLVWLNRLPSATITLVSDETLPRCSGLTIHDDLCVKPVILLNTYTKKYGKTLIHEMLHVAEPQLPHGRIFNLLVDSYWRFARKNIKQLRDL